MTSFTNRIGRIEITVNLIKLGLDWTVVITGGDRPHLGAAALGTPCPSQKTPGKNSASVSVITVTGHKDDEIARMAALSLAAYFNRNVLVACGIHVDNITDEELAQIRVQIKILLEDITAKMEKQ